MKKLGTFGFISLWISAALVLGMGCTKKKAPVIGEKAPYKIEANTVYVNNTHCAASRTKMAKKDLGLWTSKVEYKGTRKEFTGKTLVFNQCCSMCVKHFDKKWNADSEGVLKYHGLVE